MFSTGNKKRCFVSATRHCRFFSFVYFFEQGTSWQQLMLFTTLQEEQARQAKQIKVLESERLAQELLLQEKGAQIKVTKNFLSFLRKKSAVQSRCWRMRTWLLQLCLATSRNNYHRYKKQDNHKISSREKQKFFSKKN